MSDISLSSGTTALTNALKQVFYIHKDVVAELKVKLDSLKKENDELKQPAKQISENGSGPCLSCKHLKELNRTLQENFNSRLGDKNAIIKHLEERLKNLSRCVDTQVDSERITTPSLEQSLKPKDNVDDKMSHRVSSPTDGKHSMTSSQKNVSSSDAKHSVTSPDESANGNKTGRLSSKLSLPREGHKRRRYVEQEDHIQESKRRKTSPSSNQNSNENHSPHHCLHDNKNTSSGFDDNKERRKSRSSGSENSHNESPLQRVLVPETENFTCPDTKGNNNKYDQSFYFTTKMKNGLSDEESPNLLVIPETMGMEDSSEEEDCEFMGTLREVKQNPIQTSIERKILSEQAVQHFNLPSSSYKNNKNMTESPSETNKNPNRERVSPSKSTTNDQAEKKEVTSCVTISSNVKNSLNDVSMTSPLSPGIFEQLARPKSSSETPRSAKMTEDERINLKTVSSISTTLSKDVKVVEDHHEFRSLVDHSDNSRRLLRQTTLSQSFSVNSKTGNRMNKSKHRMGTEDDNDNDEDEEEAAIQEAVRQSLLEAEKKERIVLRRDDKTKCGSRSPFKIPLSPVSRKSPRTRGKSSNNEKMHSEESIGENGRILDQRDTNSPTVKFTSNFDDIFISSPSKDVKVAQRQGSRTSPRFLSSQGHSSTSPRGDLAKKALFLDGGKSPPNKTGTPSKTLKSLKSSSGKETAMVAQCQQDCLTEGLTKERMKIASFQDMNASLDPDMRLSMYLDSEGTSAPTTQIPSKVFAADELMCSQAGALMDMDETVAPNLMSLGAMETQNTTTAKNRRVEGFPRRDDVSLLVDDDVSLVVDDNVSLVVDDDDEDGVHDERNESKDNIDETIAPSPQQQSLRFLSQSQSRSQSQSLPSTGIPSTSRSFKFVNKVQNGRAPSHKDSSTAKVQKDKASSNKDGKTIEEESLDLTDDAFRNTTVAGGPLGDVSPHQHTRRPVADVSPHQHNRRPVADVSPHQHTSRSLADVSPHQDNRRPVASLYDSFDIVPAKPAEFPHVQVIRKKSERDKLQGFSCKQCFEYYKDMNLSEKELQQRMRNCSRHKDKYKPPSTPEHFWSLSIRDTAEDQPEEDDRPEVVRLRRRRRLQKKFRSKGEEEEECE